MCGPGGRYVDHDGVRSSGSALPDRTESCRRSCRASSPGRARRLIPQGWPAIPQVCGPPRRVAGPRRAGQLSSPPSEAADRRGWLTGSRPVVHCEGMWVEMATLVAIGYEDETTATAASLEAQRLSKDLIIQPDAIAVIIRDREGKFHVT